MKFVEVFKIALKNVRSNLLRTIITMLVIAFGIAALVGILTAIDTAILTMSSNFSSLGAQSFSVAPRDQEVDRIVRGKKEKRSTPITYDEAKQFKKKFKANGRVSISFRAKSSVVTKYGEIETNPVTTLIGVDENELYTRGNELEHGRFFTEKEIRNREHLAVVGSFIVSSLFNDKPERALGKRVLIDGVRYTIIGTLESSGASMNDNSDKKLLIPVSLAKSRYATDKTNFSIDVGVMKVDEMDQVISETIGTMRQVRRLKTKEENDFEIRKADGLIEIIRENTSKLRWGAIAIGIITLLGAAIGLMNIMLVSVSERTKEIGIIKSLGATRRSIVQQFLTEAIVICQLGGILGILLGILAGVGVSQAMGGVFTIPWLWIFLGITLCMLVGLVSGLYPALKASRLDPIESLRYE